ncbi:site-2 protease family protein [Candidatus Woesearchaeota archaeon]|nr:site-2 protease family protein [Candidatus Woesearchaeota archaeon]
MNGTTTIFRVSGIEVRIHYSWWIIFVLLSWSLATAFFPLHFPGLTKIEYGGMGIISALLLFCSVLLHELSHSLVAKAKKIQVENITLFFFGGVAGITTEEMKPSTEFLMALAGPVFSFVFSGISYVLFLAKIQIYITTIAFYLYQINFVLALFNLLPGYPLDGGRAFRALLSYYYKDLKKATRIAVKGGKIVASSLIILGIWSFFTNSGSGLWFIILGGFLYFIAGLSYEQVILREVLKPILVEEVIIKKCPVVDAEMKIGDFVTKFRKENQQVFFVKSKTFQGILELEDLGNISEKIKEGRNVKTLAKPLSAVQEIQKKDTVYNALQKLSEQGRKALPVVEKGKVVGIITREAIHNRLLWELKIQGQNQIIQRIKVKR